MNQDEQLYKEIYPVKYFRDYLQHNIRPDGRNLLGSRPLQLNVNSITTSDGSATIKLGNTVVVCGVKAEIAQPTATEPDQGFFVPNVEYTPLCSPKYRPGAPPEEAQVCSRTLFDILTNSNCLNLKDLNIISEKFVWTLYCDVIVLNDDGCVLDAAVIALVAALKTVKLPKIDYDLSTEQASADENTKIALRVGSLPIATSFMIFDEKVIADPTAEEEKLSAACTTVAITNSELSFLYKPGGEPVEPEMLEKCIKQAISREKHVLELLTKVLNQKT